MAVLVFGSLNLDLVTYANKLPTMGQTVIGLIGIRFSSVASGRPTSPL